MFGNEAVVEYYDLEAFNEKSQAEELISLFTTRFDSETGIRWGIREKVDNKLIGTCGFNSWDVPMRTAVIGYELHPEYWGIGMANEAISSILHAAFSGLLVCGPLHRIQADVVPGNEASVRLLTKLGFQYEGLRRDCGYWKNQFHDLMCFGLLAHEFE